MLIPPTVAEAELPAWSMQVPVTDCDPSRSSLVGFERVSTPEGESVHVKETVTVKLFHPKLLAPGDLEPLIDGGVRSMLMLVSDVLSELPAKSTQVPVTVWFRPSPRVVGDERLFTPDRMSVHVKLTVTGPLFQPWLLGGTDLVLEMVGVVRSMLILLDVVEAEFPATSRHVPVTD